MSWVSSDDSGVGDACTVLSYCDTSTSDFDDGSAYGLAVLVVEDNGVAGAKLVGTVALVPV